MANLSRYLFLLGALPFVVMGLAHAVKTPLTPHQAKGLAPREPTFRQAMSHETVLLTRRTNMWLLWVGFNFSHSIGAVLFGVVVLLVGRSQASFDSQAGVFVPMAVLVSGLYLMVGVRYWFRTPILGTTFASICFVLSWLLMKPAG